MAAGFAIENVLRHLRIPSEWYALREVRQKDLEYAVRNGSPEFAQTGWDHGVMVEVMVKGYIGYAGTNQLDPSGVQKAAERALAQAQAAAHCAVTSFPHRRIRAPHQGRYDSPQLKPLAQTQNEQIMDSLLTMSRHLAVHDQIVDARATARLVEVEQNYVSSTGAKIEQNFLFASWHMEATAQDGPVTQTRSDSGIQARNYQAGSELLTAPELVERAARIGQEAMELLTAEECPSGTMDLILMPDQMMLQIHESIGHPLELDRILGDERNYAGFSFVRAQDFGHLQYGSSLLNVTFDPTYPGELASYAFDDAGQPAYREYLIQNGRLLRALGGSESQFRSGLPGVANFRASDWRRAPLDRMANINLEPGTTPFAEIIASTPRGVLMAANRSWSIDDYRNKFQFGCEYGKLIEEGRITRTVRNPNYRGVTIPFWNSLDQVGDGATCEVFGTPYCGKGEPNQIIRVGHASPVCRFRNIEVFGGHS